MGNTQMNEEFLASTEEVKERIANDDIYIIDVRSPGELGRGQSSIIRSKLWTNIPLSQFEQAIGLTDIEFENKYGLCKPNKDGSNLVINCASGNRSATALEIAHKYGYVKAKHYPGGYRKWQSEQ